MNINSAKFSYKVYSSLLLYKCFSTVERTQHMSWDGIMRL